MLLFILLASIMIHTVSDGLLNPMNPMSPLSPANPNNLLNPSNPASPNNPNNIRDNNDSGSNITIKDDGKLGCPIVSIFGVKC